MKNPQLMEAGAHHQEWLRHPVTQRLRSLHKIREERLLSKICAAASDPSKDDKVVRALVVQLEQLKTLQKVTYDTDGYIENIESAG